MSHFRERSLVLAGFPFRFFLNGCNGKPECESTRNPECRAEYRFELASALLEEWLDEPNLETQTLAPLRRARIFEKEAHHFLCCVRPVWIRV